MTATPIPRTAAMVVFGDLDRSVLDEMPAGRRPIETTGRTSDARGRARAGSACATRSPPGAAPTSICPLVEGSETRRGDERGRGARPASRSRSCGARGRPPARPDEGPEKEEVMAQFRAGELDVLVATVVIEVGVDVPEASVIVIEDAWRFGLAQLHQLRGRVGRSDVQSYCYLLGDAAERRGRGATPGAGRLQRRLRARRDRPRPARRGHAARHAPARPQRPAPGVAAPRRGPAGRGAQRWRRAMVARDGLRGAARNGGRTAALRRRRRSRLLVQVLRRRDVPLRDASHWWDGPGTPAEGEAARECAPDDRLRARGDLLDAREPRRTRTTSSSRTSTAARARWASRRCRAARPRSTSSTPTRPASPR